MHHPLPAPLAAPLAHRRPLLTAVWLVAAVLGIGPAAADDPVFSGPQAGERLPPLQVTDVQWKGKTPRQGVAFSSEPVTWIDKDAEQPTLLIFVHELTRPGIGLVRGLTQYVDAIQSQDDEPSPQVFSGVVFLTNDATETQQWMRRAQSVVVQLRQKSRIGLSVDGQEGPGAYGLNRNVELTVLVAKAGKVTANFAIVQPSLQADALKIAAAVAKSAGVEAPTQESLQKIASMGMPRAARSRPPAPRPVDLRSILSPLLDKSLSKEEVAAAAADVEAVAATRPEVRKAIGRVTARIVAAGKIGNYGTPAAQEHLQAWAKKWAPDDDSKEEAEKESGRPRRKPGAGDGR